VDIGIGIPNSIPGTTGSQLLEWARRAEAAGFSSLATIGAVSYPSYEELTLFAAAGAVTERIRFMPNVLISPARSTAELAKQAATVQQLTGGRLTLGLGVGWRESDYQLTGKPFRDRGRLFDEQLADLKRAWAGEAIADGTRPVSPDPGPSGVPMIIGGHSEVAIRRVAEVGVGWSAGGLPPDAVKPLIDQVRAAWSVAGRDGAPRNVALAYFALGEDKHELARSNLFDYYSPMGDDMAQMIAGSFLSSPEAIKGAVAAFADMGVDELMLDPAVSSLDQVDRLAEIVF
jgi:alkanesulfonate monooxygenase SsuD/methylene tetrahydromethanopterin reductase-like flavin-dependent oxidoreductase (luciferase family)